MDPSVPTSIELYMDSSLKKRRYCNPSLSQEGCPYSIVIGISPLETRQDIQSRIDSGSVVNLL